MAPDRARHGDERTGVGIHRAVRRRNQHAVPAGSPANARERTYTADFNAVKALGRRTGSTRTDAQTELAPFWEGNASVHWNQAANQIARANELSMSKSNRLLAALNIAMADTALTIWSAKRHYGADAAEVTWRPLTAITLADTDGNPETTPDPSWLPLVTTPSHPEYPAGHPALNGAAATILAGHFADAQTFTLTTPGLPSQTYAGISQARSDGNNARVWGGMHYPSTVAISDAVGEAIADYVNATSMRSLREVARPPDNRLNRRFLGRASPGPAQLDRLWSSRCRGTSSRPMSPDPVRRKLAQQDGKLAAAAQELVLEGTPVRYVRTTFLPDDETCFHIFDAGSEETVGEVCRRAGISSARIVRAMELSAGDSRRKVG